MEYSCKKCSFSWKPRTLNPLTCPKCRSKNWKRDKMKTKETKAKEVIILESPALSEMIILVSGCEVNNKKYSELLNENKQTVSAKLVKLKKLGLTHTKWKKRKKIWTINSEKLNEIAKKYALKKVESDCNKELSKIENKANFDPEIKGIKHNQKMITETRRKVAENIRKKKVIELERIEKIFSFSKFVNFMFNYIYLVYPNTKIPFKEVIEYYVNWGSKQ